MTQTGAWSSKDPATVWRCATARWCFPRSASTPPEWFSPARCSAPTMVQPGISVRPCPPHRRTPTKTRFANSTTDDSYFRCALRVVPRANGRGHTTPQAGRIRCAMDLGKLSIDFRPCRIRYVKGVCSSGPVGIAATRKNRCYLAIQRARRRGLTSRSVPRRMAGRLGRSRAC